MNIKIDTVDEKDIIIVRSLVINQKILDQVRILTQKELEIVSDKLGRWIGYVNEPEKATRHQTIWMLNMIGNTLVKTRDSEYFWILRAREENHQLTADQLQDLLRKELDALPQIFIG